MARDPLHRRRRQVRSDPSGTRHRGRRRAAFVLGAAATAGVIALAMTVDAVVQIGGAETAQPATFGPTDDAYVSAAWPNANTGSSTKLAATEKPGDRKIIYLRFQVVAGTAVGSARLTLTRTDHHFPPALAVYRTDASGWSEKTLTMRTAPKLGELVGAIVTPATGRQVSVDLSAVVRGAGSYAFAIVSPATDDVAILLSKEAGAGGPLLSTWPTAGPADPSPSASPIPTLPPVASPSPTPTPTPSTSPSGTSGAPAAPGGMPGCTVSDLLVPSCGAWIGAAPGAHDFSVSRTQQLATFEANAGRKMDVMHVYHTDGSLFPTSTEIAIARQPGSNRLLFVNWKPSTSQSWRSVANGAADAQIDRLAAHIKATFPERFFLAIYHEPENDVNPTAGSGWTASDYRAMYRHVALRLRGDGVHNAVLTMVYMGFAKWGAQPWFDDLYPGSDVVDWLGYDPYASVDKSGSDFAQMVNKTLGMYSDWPGFYSWAQQRVPGKPMVLAEWGVAESDVNPGGKAAFFRGVVADAKDFPRIKAMVYFDSAVAHNGDTRITSSSTSLAGFRDMAADTYFRQTVPQS